MLILTIACTILWGVTDILYRASFYKNDPLAYHKSFVWVGHNNAAAQSVLDIKIHDGDDGLKYVFDYAAERYDKETILDFKNIFKRVIAAIVNNANTDGYDFKQLKKDIRDKKGLKEKIEDTFYKKK